MAQKKRNTLKGFFETGKRPTEGNFTDLIDSFVSLKGENTGSLDIKGNTIIEGTISSSGDLTVSGITSSGAISASGTETSFIGGTFIIGNEISASGGISSSGTIEAQQFIGDGRFLTNITSSTVTVSAVTASFTSGAPTGSLIVSGNLFHSSASSDILMAIKTTGSIIPADTSNYDLGSPTNFWKSLFVSNSFAVTYTGIFNGALSGSSLASSQQGTAVLTTNGVAGSDIDLGLKVTDNVIFNNITSSGGISASGTIFANNFQSAGGNDQMSFNDNLSITGSITASGNISASGNIETNTIVTNAGDLIIKNTADDKDIIFQSDDSSGGITEYFRVDGGSEKTFYSKPILLFDSVALQLGTDTDATLFHTGGEGTLQNNTGNFRIIQGQDNGDIQFFCDDGTGSVTEYIILDGGDVSTRILTNVTASGNISSSRTGSFGMLIVDQNITSSNISASGTLTAGTTTVGVLTSTALNTGPISASGNLRIVETGSFGRVFVDKDVSAKNLSGSGELIIRKSSDEGTPTPGTSNLATFQNNGSGQGASISIVASDSKNSGLQFGRHDDIDVGSIRYFHDDHSLKGDTLEIRVSASQAAAFKGIGTSTNTGLILGKNYDELSASPLSDYLTVQGALAGLGMTISSSNAARFNIERGATNNAIELIFKTAQTQQWTIGNTGESNNNLFIYNGPDDTKVVTFTSSSGNIEFHGSNVSAKTLTVTSITSSKTAKFGGTVYVSGSIYSGSGTDAQAAGGQGSALVALVVTGSIVPQGSDNWSLGSPTNFFKDLYVGQESIKFISASGEVSQLRQKDVKDIREGRPVELTQKSFSAVGSDDSVDGLRNYIRPEAIYHPTDDETAILLNTIGKLSYRSPGGDPFIIHADGSGNDRIQIGSTTTNNTKVQIPGFISASRTNANHIIGGTTRFGSSTVTINGPAGHITASGDISASGIVTGLTGSFSKINVGTLSGTNNIDFADGIDVDGFVSAMGIGTPSNITHNVTVPSNINAIQLTNNTGDITIPAGIDYTVSAGATTSTPFLLDAIGGGAFMTGSLKIKGSISASGLIEATSASFGNLSVNAFGDITSSGTISASGDLIATNISGSGDFEGVSYQIQGKSAITYNSANSRIIYGQNNQNSRLRGNTITLGDDATQHVTASGHISASGTGSFNNISIAHINPLPGGTIALNAEVNQAPGNAFFVGGDMALTNTSARLSLNTNAHIDFNSGSGDLKMSGGGTTDTISITAPNTSFSGHITASKNISSSGNVTTTNLSASGDLRVAGTGSFSNLVVDGNSGLTISSGAITGSIISGSTIIASQLTGSLSGNASGLFGNPNIAVTQLTASATISSSGDIVTTNLTVANTSSLSHLSIAGTLSSSAIISAVSMSGDGSGLTNVTAKWDGSRNGDASITGSLVVSGSGNTGLNTLGSITASVGISSSTLITGKTNITNLTASQDISSSGTITALSGSFGNMSVSAFGATNFTSHITASGNVSSSATGSFGMLVVDQNITSSNISASNFVIANTIVTDTIQSHAGQNIITDNGTTIGIENRGFSMEGQLTSAGVNSISHITASGNISASETITSKEINVIGHITASGNISASGTVFADNFQSAGGDDQMSFTDNINLTGNLTASGDISASGNIIASQITASIISASGTLTAGTTTVGALTATTINTGQGNNELFDMDQNVLTTSTVKFSVIHGTSNTGTALINSGSTLLGNAVSDTHAITGNVTASGNISSSGTITAATLAVDTFTPSTINTGNITGSGTISASGLLSASNIHTVGNVTLLGNISGSGTSTLTIGGNASVNNLIGNEITASGGISSSFITVGQITASTISGDGSALTGVTAEWDGTLNGDASITGSLVLSGSNSGLNVLGAITASGAISSSTTVFAQDILASAIIQNPNVPNNTVIPAGHNAILFVTRYNPSITVTAGTNYTVSAGADVTLLNTTS